MNAIDDQIKDLFNQAVDAELGGSVDVVVLLCGSVVTVVEVVGTSTPGSGADG